MLVGSFHEISIEVADAQQSLEFYESLGFSQCVTGDAWPHPYAVVTDGRAFLGLHQYKFPSPSLTFVRPGIREAAREFEAAGIKLAFAKLTEDAFNEFGFRDPCGQMTAVLEARTYFPSERRIQDTSACGDFAGLSIPCGNFDAAREFWERLGFVALDVTDRPYAQLPLTSDGVDLSLHRPSFSDRPLLLFTDPQMADRIETLRQRGLEMIDLPRGLDPQRNAMLQSPEGMQLLLVDVSPE